MKMEDKIYIVKQGGSGNFRKTETGFEFLLNDAGMIKLYKYNYTEDALKLSGTEECGIYDEGAFTEDGIIYRKNSKVI